jgi:hypothetical protein
LVWRYLILNRKSHTNWDGLTRDDHPPEIASGVA